MTDKQTVADILGYRIAEDSDQPGMWLWKRMSGRTLVEGSDISFPTQEEASLAADMAAAGEVMGENNLGAEDWDAMPLERKLELARELAGTSPPASPRP